MVLSEPIKIWPIIKVKEAFLDQVILELKSEESIEINGFREQKIL